jgi:hypothetical protein
MAKKVRRAPEPDLDEVPSFAKARLASQAKRAQKARAYDEKLTTKLLGQLGVTRAVLKKRADEDFAQAKSESAQRVKQLRALQEARIKQRGPLRVRIEAALAQTGRTEVPR